MEARLSKLFDFQCFAGNERLTAVIGTVESRYSRELSDDELEMVSAAGTGLVPPGKMADYLSCIPENQAEGEEL